jgi:glycine/D-amino acid oxidase-like deaminating enzyme
MNQQSATQTRKSDAPWTDIVAPTILAELKLENLASAPKSVIEQTYDLAVVGGGIAGLSTARAAAKCGARVILLERAGAVAAGASGKNAGILGAGVNMPLVSMPKGHPAMGMWRSTSELLPRLYSLAADKKNNLIAKNVGALSLAKSATACKRLHQEAKARNAAGLNAEIISAAKVADLTSDYLDLRDVQAALYLPDEGRINPLTLLAFIARETKHCGGTLFGGAEITARQLIPRKSAPFQNGSSKDNVSSTKNVSSGDNVSSTKNVSSNDNVSSSENFASSDNIWKLSTACGVDVYASSLVYATGPVINANRRIYAVSFRINLPESFPLFWDSNPFTYYDYRAGEGYITVTGGRYGTAGQTANDAKFHNSMIAAAKSWMPALRTMEPSHMWAVNLEVDADMMPNIVILNESPIALSIQGLGALGVLPGMVLGEEAGSKLAVIAGNTAD